MHSNIKIHIRNREHFKLYLLKLGFEIIVKIQTFSSSQERCKKMICLKLNKVTIGVLELIKCNVSTELAIIIIYIENIKTLEMVNTIGKILKYSDCELRPTKKELINLLLLDALAYEQYGDQKLAIDLCKQVLKVDPNNARAWECLGSARLNLGNFTYAMKSLNNAIDLNSNYLSALAKLGSCYYKLSLHEKARYYYEKAEKIKPKMEGDWTQKGITLLRLGKYWDAYIHFKIAYTEEIYNSKARMLKNEALQNLIKALSDKYIPLSFGNSSLKIDRTIFVASNGQPDITN